MGAHVKILIGSLISLAAIPVGGIGCLMMSGFGICAADVTWGLFLFCFACGALSSGLVAVLWPRGWLVGAFAFSLPACLGLVFAIGIGEGLRIAAISACMLGAFFVAFVGARFRRQAV